MNIFKGQNLLEFDERLKQGKHFGKDYDKFRVIQDKNYISDFDREIKRLKEQDNDQIL